MAPDETTDDETLPVIPYDGDDTDVSDSFEDTPAYTPFTIEDGVATNVEQFDIGKATARVTVGAVSVNGNHTDLHDAVHVDVGDTLAFMAGDLSFEVDA